MNMARLGGSRLQAPFGDGHKRKCPICGAAFMSHEGWAYSRTKSDGRGEVYCSYKCFRVWEREEEKKIRERIARTDGWIDKREEYQKKWQERKQKKKQQEREKECVEE